MTEIGELRGEVRTTWQHFLEVFEPLRPELYRYCRYLTRSPWDAEDLVQDTLARGFVTLGTLFHQIPEPRAWLFRVATNLWIDRARRHQRERAIVADPMTALRAAPDRPSEPREPREATGTLLVQLSAQERAAVVLKDVFELSIEDVAAALSTTPGAVKSALHRGRGKLVEPEPEPTRVPAPGALDAVCAAFNARDLEALTALLLDSAVTEIVGVVTEYGQDGPADENTGSFFHSLTPITATEAGGIAAHFLEDYLFTPPRCEVHAYRDGYLLLIWYDHATGPAVRAVWTLETEGDRVAHVRNYFFTPDVIEEVCRELGVPFRINGYRYW